MGNKKKKKEPQNKKTSQRNYERKRDIWPLCGSNALDSESLQIKDEESKELSGMNLLSSSDTFLFSFEDDECDSETIEFLLWVKEKEIE